VCHSALNCRVWQDAQENGLPTPDALLLPAFERRAHFGFRVDAQRVGDAVDVVEIGDDFRGVQDVAVTQAMLAKGIDILFADGGGSARDEVGEFCQSFAARRQIGLEIVVLGVLGQFLVAAFYTEILPVSFRSIEAVVGPGDDDGQQLAFGAGQPGRGVHRSQIEAH
jgi:hypothetical protein